MTNNILTNYSDDEFRLRAFHDYCEARKNNYIEIIGMVNESINSIPDSDEVDPESIVNNVLSNHVNQDANKAILFEDGYASLKEVLLTVVKDVADESNSQNSTVQLINAAGSNTSSIGFNEICDELKEQLHAITALSSAATAASANTVAEKITIFTNGMQEVFSNAYSDLSNTASYYKNILTNSTTIKSFFESIHQSMSLDSLSADGSTDVPRNSDISAYTGASPIGALSSGLSNGFGVIGGAVNAGVKVVAGVIGGIVQGAKALFGWVGNKLHQVIVDPYDIEETNDSTLSPTIDGWSYQEYPQNWKPNTYEVDTSASSIPGKAGLTTIQIYDIYERLNEYSNKWIKLSTKGGELVLRWSSTGIAPNQESFWLNDFKYSYKPKSLSVKLVDSAINLINTTGTINGGRSLSSVLAASQLLQQSSDIYYNTGNTEQELYNSFLAGMGADEYFLGAAVYEALGNDRYDFFPNGFIRLFTTEAVTNADFVSVASGWNKSNSNPKFQTFPLIPGNQLTQDVTRIIDCFLVAFGLNLQYAKNHPLDYPFFPYRVDKEGVSGSKYNVKTDENNFNAFSKFVTVATVVVVTAIVATAALVAVKKLTKLLYYKAAQKQSVLQAKMWDGKTLTNAEKKQYRRASRRLNKSSYLSNSLQATSSSVSNNSLLVGNESDIANSDIAALIK